jgi:predicted Zn-dependent protease
MAEQSQAILQQVLAAGFDQAQVIFDETSTDELNIENNQVNLLRSKNTLELSITAIKDHRQVKASTTQIDGNSTKLLWRNSCRVPRLPPRMRLMPFPRTKRGPLCRVLSP